MTNLRAATLYVGMAVVMLLSATLAGAQVSTGSQGQLLYVPVYSEIPHGTGRHTYRLAATLSLRNTDQQSEITLLRADYYDSKGKLLRQYIDAPITLAALASHHIVVPESDRKGGIGANFIVEWRARSQVMRPLIQTLMLTDVSLQGIAFLADAVVLEELAGLPAQ